MKLNQKGVTLVELLAALALVSIIAAIAWTALSIGFKHTAAETNKTHLQQEANLIVTKMAHEHRRSDHYYFRKNAGYLELKTCNEETSGAVTCSEFKKLTENNYQYSGSIDGIDFLLWSPLIKVDPKKDHVDFSLTVADPVNPSRSVQVETTLTRILTN